MLDLLVGWFIKWNDSMFKLLEVEMNYTFSIDWHMSHTSQIVLFSNAKRIKLRLKIKNSPGKKKWVKSVSEIVGLTIKCIDCNYY